MENLYEMLIRGEYLRVKDEVAKQGNLADHSSAHCVEALANSLLGDYVEAEQMLLEVEPDRLDDISKGTFFEAKMLIEASRHSENSLIEGLARQAIEHNPRAIFARRILGRLEESRKNFINALGEYQAALEIAPTSQRTLLDCARVLITLKRPHESFTFIRHANISFKRELYQLSAFLYSRWRILIIIALALLLINPVTSVYVFWLLIAASVLFAVYALIQRDSLILSISVYFTFVAFLFSALKWLFETVSQP